MDSNSFGWYWITASVVLVIDLGASAHVVLHKRDHRSAIGWVGVIWLVPVVGALLYFLAGINRIQRRANRLRRRHPVKRAKSLCKDAVAVFSQAFVPDVSQLAPLARLVSSVTGKPLLAGNQVQPLRNGEQAYPAMLRAIHEAKQSVAVSTYILDNDRAGKLFVEARPCEQRPPPPPCLPALAPCSFVRFRPSTDSDLPLPTRSSLQFLSSSWNWPSGLRQVEDAEAIIVSHSGTAQADKPSANLQAIFDRRQD